MPSPTVLIVGAGPVGLTTALCLQKSGVPARDILIVDQRPARESSNRWSKALSMSASSLEVFRTLGIADRFIEVGIPLHEAHFGGGPQHLALNYDVIGTKYSFNLNLPQVRSEDILLNRCEEVGIKFFWGLRFSACSQTGASVLASFHKMKSDSPSDKTEDDLVQAIEATWLIGCDGTQSAVRKAAGIEFQGPRGSRYSWLADGHCSLDAPTMKTAQDKNGRAIVSVLGDSPTARRFIAFAPPLPRDQKPAVLDENQVRDKMNETFGSHYNFHNLMWSSVVGTGMRLAETFRSGRIFLAGDAAHQVFPAGGQGMNTGILDAINLAWKLAAIITGGTRPNAIERVLDSYTTERRTSAQAVIRNIRVQLQIFLGQTEDEKAVSQFVTEALGQPKLNKAWARRVTGFGDPVEPYQLALTDEAMGGSSDDIVGTRLTHFVEDSESALLKALDQRAFILATICGSKATHAGDFKTIVKASGHGNQIHVLETPLVTSGDKWDSVAAVLIRPDFRVAWAASSDTDIEAACSSPRPVTTLGYKPLHLFGLALATISFGLFSLLDRNSSAAAWVCYQLLGAVGLGVLAAILLPAVQAPLAESEVATATGTTGFNNESAKRASSNSDSIIVALLSGGQAHEYATREFLDSLPEPELHDQVIHLFSEAIRMVWLIGVIFAGLGFLAAWIEKEVKLREELETEFGLDEKVRQSSPEEPNSTL